jgi:hypothetical protein
VAVVNAITTARIATPNKPKTRRIGVPFAVVPAQTRKVSQYVWNTPEGMASP